MASSPIWKVYNDEGQYIAACITPEVAAMVVAGHGTAGFTIRYGHQEKRTTWTEGAETMAASESYDNVAALCWTRHNNR